MAITFVNIRTYVMNRVGWPTTDTTLATRANAVINRVNSDVAMQRPWGALQRSSTLTLKAPYSTGTPTFTNASTAVSADTSVWTTNLAANDKIKPSGRDEIYVVSSVTDNTNLVLTSTYQGTTSSTGSYNSWRDEYSLASDFDRPINYQTFLSMRRILPIGLREMRERFPWPAIPGDPKYYTLIRPGAAIADKRSWYVLLYPPPDEAEMIPYEYITTNLAYTTAGAGQETLSADTDEPWMEDRFRHVLIWGSLAEIYRDYKDDQRTQECLSLFHDMVRRMANDEPATNDRPRLKPNLGGWQWLRMAKRTPRYDIHDRFDRMEW